MNDSQHKNRALLLTPLEFATVSHALSTVLAGTNTLSETDKEVVQDVWYRMFQATERKITAPDIDIDFTYASEPMSLAGGIDTYSMPTTRYLTDESPKGRKVVFLNSNGMQGDKDYARKYFTEGQVLTVDEIYVGRSSSEVTFEELPNKRFNTVMFTDQEQI